MNPQSENEIWGRSIREEIAGALWFIAALLAWIAVLRWLAWILFFKAGLDILASVCFALAGIGKERTLNHPTSKGLGE